ncbi:hypothetical protein DPMN_043273, partial [Dreissena polymorpha]
MGSPDRRQLHRDDVYPTKQSAVDVSLGSCKIKEEFAVCNLQPSSDKPSNINGTIYFMQKLV